MIDTKRRLLLKYAVGVGAVGLAAGAGLMPRPALAAAGADSWPEKAFDEKAVDAAVAAMYQGSPEDSGEVKLDAPEIAENGAVVPIKVDATGIEGVTSISLYVDKNPFALTASYDIAEGTLPYVSSRVKMQESATVIALVHAGDKLYRATRDVKVTIGGCGG